MHALTQTVNFLLSSLFEMFIFLIVLRFIFQFIRVDFYNPISQAIVKLTNPALLPLRRIIPSIKGLDTAGLVLLFAVCLIKLTLSCLLQYHTLPALGGLLIWATGDLINLTLTLFFWAIIIQALMSWLSSSPAHPIYGLLQQITTPLMQPARKLIKPIAGIDLSPIVILLFLQVLIMLIAIPLRQQGIAWSL